MSSPADAAPAPWVLVDGFATLDGLEVEVVAVAGGVALHVVGGPTLRFTRGTARRVRHAMTEADTVTRWNRPTEGDRCPHAR